MLLFGKDEGKEYFRPFAHIAKKQGNLGPRLHFTNTYVPLIVLAAKSATFATNLFSFALIRQNHWRISMWWPMQQLSANS